MVPPNRSEGRSEGFEVCCGPAGYTGYISSGHFDGYPTLAEAYRGLTHKILAARANPTRDNWFQPTDTFND